MRCRIWVDTRKPSIVTGKRSTSGLASPRLTTTSATPWRPWARPTRRSKPFAEPSSSSLNTLRAHLNLADLLAAAGRGAEALETYRTAVALAPECAEAHCNFGITQRASGDSAAAIESCRRAIELSPELAAAHVNLGNALRDLGRLEEAIVAYQRGVSLAPDAADAHMNLGEAYREAGDPCAAVACQRRAVRLEPDSAEAHYELARALLTIGDFENGWCEYQWRERMHFASAAREPSTPAISPLRRDGSPLDGRSLLISCHEPLGTQLLFASVLPDLAAQQGRVVLQCEPRLTPLLRRSFAHVDVFDSSEAHDGGALERPMHFDLHSSLGGLPELFRRTPADFPRHGGYLRPDSAKRDDWRKRLADLGERFVVGLSWQAGAAPRSAASDRSHLSFGAKSPRCPRWRW